MRHVPTKFSRFRMLDKQDCLLNPRFLPRIQLQKQSFLIMRKKEVRFFLLASIKTESEYPKSTSKEQLRHIHTGITMEIHLSLTNKKRTSTTSGCPLFLVSDSQLSSSLLSQMQYLRYYYLLYPPRKNGQKWDIFFTDNSPSNPYI